MPAASPERIDSLINRLSARRRWARAARLYGHWLDACRREAGADGSTPHPMMWKYGRLLRQAGDDAGAAAVFREMALSLSHGDGRASSSFFLQRSYEEWARCLEAMGEAKSAAQTRALGRRVAAQRARETGDELKTLQPSRLLRPVARRLTFGLSLEWEGPSESFDLFVEDGLVTLRRRFRYNDPPGPWLEFEARAPVEPDPTYPHVAVCVKLPPCFAGAGAVAAALELVNRINQENAACSCCLEAESGQIALRGRIGFAGYNEAVEPLLDLATAQEEATLNMMAEVVSTAIDWCGQALELAACGSGTESAAQPDRQGVARHAG